MEYLTKMKNAVMFKSLSTVMEDHTNKEDRIITDYNEMNETPIIKQPVSINEHYNKRDDALYKPPKQSFFNKHIKKHEETPFSKFKIWGQPK